MNGTFKQKYEKSEYSYYESWSYLYPNISEIQPNSLRLYLYSEFFLLCGFDELWQTLDHTLSEFSCYDGIRRKSYFDLGTDISMEGDTVVSQTQTNVDGTLNLSINHLSDVIILLIPLLEACYTIQQASVASSMGLSSVLALDTDINVKLLSASATQLELQKMGDKSHINNNLSYDSINKTDSKTAEISKLGDISCNGNIIELLNDKCKQKHHEIIRFSYRHRRSLNSLLQSFPQLLLPPNGSLVPLLRLAPMVVNFENKRTYFRHRLRQLRRESSSYRNTDHHQLRLVVRRNRVFMDSYQQISTKTSDQLKQKLHITFHGEEGVDAGGVTREWYNILAREMFNPDYALFRREGSKSEFNHPNPLSYINADHLHFFKFIGRIIGKCIYDGQHLDAWFTRSFYKHMLGQPITPADAEPIDPELYRNLNIMLEHPIEDLGLELNFTTTIDEFGRSKLVELKPNGANIAVTDENKYEYVCLLCEYKTVKLIEKQLNVFLSGFHELIPSRLIAIFDDKELELLISGSPTINLNDLRDNTEYHNYTKNSQQIIWFWETLEEFDQNRLATFVQFVTGTSRVPLGGFKNLMGMRGPQKFSIHKAFGENRLPSAHTCFNQLDLPNYSSKEQLRAKLLQAITEGKEGFALV